MFSLYNEKGETGSGRIWTILMYSFTNVVLVSYQKTKTVLLIVLQMSFGKVIREFIRSGIYATDTTIFYLLSIYLSILSVQSFLGI